MEKQELKALIKETMKEVIQEERASLSQILIPYVSDKEQEELVDLTDWVENGG